MSGTDLSRRNLLSKAGFRPPSAGALGLQSADAPFPILATGNWGCGVFGGHVELKSVLQWMAASEGKINVRYFPFNEPVGPRLQHFCDKCVEVSKRSLTVDTRCSLC